MRATFLYLPKPVLCRKKQQKNTFSVNIIQQLHVECKLSQTHFSNYVHFTFPLWKSGIITLRFVTFCWKGTLVHVLFILSVLSPYRSSRMLAHALDRLVCYKSQMRTSALMLLSIAKAVWCLWNKNFIKALAPFLWSTTVTDVTDGCEKACPCCQKGSRYKEEMWRGRGGSGETEGGTTYSGEEVCGDKGRLNGAQTVGEERALLWWERSSESLVRLSGIWTSLRWLQCLFTVILCEAVGETCAAAGGCIYLAVDKGGSWV